MIRIEEINDLNRFQPGRKIWNDLALKSKGATIFQTYEWISSYINHFPDPTQIIILLAFKNDELVGIAPLQKLELCFLKFVKHRKIVFLGEIFSEYCDFITDPEYAEEVINLFIGYIFDHYRGYSNIDLRDIRGESLTNTFVKKSKSYDVEHFNGEKYLFINTSVDKLDYYDRYNSKSINTLNRKSEKLNKLKPEFLFSSSINIDQIRLLSDFNKQRLSFKGETSFFFDDRNMRFTEELTAKLSDSNNIMLGICNLEKKECSFFLCFIYQKIVYFFISGFDSRYLDVSLGSMHLKVVIDYCFDNNFLEFDFLRGEDAYKYRYHPESRITNRIVVIRRKGITLFQKLFIKLKISIKKLR